MCGSPFKPISSKASTWPQIEIEEETPAMTVNTYKNPLNKINNCKNNTSYEHCHPWKIQNRNSSDSHHRVNPFQTIWNASWKKENFNSLQQTHDSATMMYFPVDPGSLRRKFPFDKHYQLQTKLQIKTSTKYKHSNISIVIVHLSAKMTQMTNESTQTFINSKLKKTKSPKNWKSPCLKIFANLYIFS